MKFGSHPCRPFVSTYASEATAKQTNGKSRTNFGLLHEHEVSGLAPVVDCHSCQSLGQSDVQNTVAVPTRRRFHVGI